MGERNGAGTLEKDLGVIARVKGEEALSGLSHMLAAAGTVAHEQVIAGFRRGYYVGEAMHAYIWDAEGRTLLYEAAEKHCVFLTR